MTEICDRLLFKIVAAAPLLKLHHQCILKYFMENVKQNFIIEGAFLQGDLFFCKYSKFSKTLIWKTSGNNYF